MKVTFKFKQLKELASAFGAALVVLTGLASAMTAIIKLYDFLDSLCWPSEKADWASGTIGAAIILFWLTICIYRDDDRQNRDNKQAEASKQQTQSKERNTIHGQQK